MRALQDDAVLLADVGQKNDWKTHKVHCHTT